MSVAAVSAVVSILTVFSFLKTSFVLSCKQSVGLTVWKACCSAQDNNHGEDKLLLLSCVKLWEGSQENRCPPCYTNNIEHHKGFNCSFLFTDLYSVSSGETGVISIWVICISEFPILPLKATASVQAVHPPHPHLHSTTHTLPLPLSSALPVQYLTACTACLFQYPHIHNIWVQQSVLWRKPDIIISKRGSLPKSQMSLSVAAWKCIFFRRE